MYLSGHEKLTIRQSSEEEHTVPSEGAHRVAYVLMCSLLLRITWKVALAVQPKVPSGVDSVSSGNNIDVQTAVDELLRNLDALAR